MTTHKNNLKQIEVIWRIPRHLVEKHLTDWHLVDLPVHSSTHWYIYINVPIKQVGQYYPRLGLGLLSRKHVADRHLVNTNLIVCSVDQMSFAQMASDYET